jgi:hypothetical protein
MRRLKDLISRDELGSGESPFGRSDPSAAPAVRADPAPLSRAGAGGSPVAATAEDPGIDLLRRRDELRVRFAELQCDLGGLVYEMAIRDHVRVDVLVKRAAALQDVDAELGEVERILHLEETGTAGHCATCAAPHSTGAVYCWQCGQPLLEHVPSDAIGA